MDDRKRKWSESHGPDAMEWVSSKIPKETKDSFTKWSERFFDPVNLRSLQVFCGTGEQRPFYIKRGEFRQIRTRVSLNLKFFYLNYVAIAASVLGVAFVTSSAVLVLIFLLGVWALALKLTKGGSLAVRDFVFPRKAVLLVLGVCTTFIVSGIMAALVSTTAFVSAIIAGGHALLRDETSLPAVDQVHSKKEKSAEMCTESIDENSLFLSTDEAENAIEMLGGYVAVPKDEEIPTSC